MSKSKPSRSHRKPRRSMRKRSSPKRKMYRKPTRKAGRRSPMKSMKRRTTRRRRSTGTMSATGSSARITGTFQGDIYSAGHLCIARGAKCNTNLKAPSVQIDGTAKGMIVAKNTMKLGPSCHVHGTIVADKLVCAEGASFYGQCRLGRYKKAA